MADGLFQCVPTEKKTTKHTKPPTVNSKKSFETNITYYVDLHMVIWNN